MPNFFQRFWHIAISGGVLFALSIGMLSQYGWNPSAFLHLDERMLTSNESAKNLVILSVPGYDGMQYYRIAKILPKIFDAKTREELRNNPTLSYSFQRFLLPLTASILSLGAHERALPWFLLGINITALLATCIILGKRVNGKFAAIGLALSPAALIGIHFSLAEPLSLLLITLFLLRYVPTYKLRIFDIVLLSLIVLSREVNIIFIAVLAIHSLILRQWKSLFLLIIPAVVFVALHSGIYALFHEIPFLWSGEKNALPFTAFLEIILGKKGFSAFTLSSITLFFGFVAPSIILILYRIYKNKRATFLQWASLVFLGIMLSMPDHIWSSITSIGRVITPVYPLLALEEATNNTLCDRLLASSTMILGVAIGIALTLIHHPWSLS